MRESQRRERRGEKGRERLVPEAGTMASVTLHSLSNGKTYRFYAVAVNDALWPQPAKLKPKLLVWTNSFLR